jgi:hypothetical protein
VISAESDSNFRTHIDGMDYFPDTVVDLFIANTMYLKISRGSPPANQHKAIESLEELNISPLGGAPLFV